MNKIRIHFADEVEALIPILHGAYRAVGRYQKQRTDRNRDLLLAEIGELGPRLQFFKPMVPARKQPYFDAILNETLSISDRIVALDVSVGAMHIEFAVERAYMHPESEALRRALATSREDPSDGLAFAGEPSTVEASDGVLVRGIAASPGVVTGKAALVLRNADYRRLPAGSIVVARMTRPEMILALDRIKAIVTDAGGSLCHAAVVARELGIPCVVGTQRATEVIHNKQLITVNGSIGCVSAAKRGQ